MLDHIAAEPAWARLGVVETLAAGPTAIARRDDAVTAFGALLQPGFELRPDLPEVVAEAISGAIFGLLYTHIRTRGTARVAELGPVSTFIGLAPFVGADEAAAIANEPRRRVRPPA
jgi:hypothetical protein